MEIFSRRLIVAICMILSHVQSQNMLFANEHEKLILKMVLLIENQESAVMSDHHKETVAFLNNDLFASSRLEIVYNGSPVLNMSEKIDNIKEYLDESGIPSKKLKVIVEEDPKTIKAFNLRNGCLYLAYHTNEKTEFTKGMNLAAQCARDTIIETERNYGLFYNLCDFEDKIHLPQVRVWGKDADNGLYHETPAKPVDYYVNHVLTIFTVLRNDSDDVPDGIVIPVQELVSQKKLHLEKYLPRAYKWVPASNVQTCILKRNKRTYLHADVEQSGHYRFVSEPVESSTVFVVHAPENACFKEILIEEGPTRIYKGTLFNGKTAAVFVTPSNPKDLKCTMLLKDTDGKEMEISSSSLGSIASFEKITEKNKNQNRFTIPGYKTVTAEGIYRISKLKKNNNKPLYSKL